MDYPPSSRRTHKARAKSELYSTVVIHSGSDSESDSGSRKSKSKSQLPSGEPDIYATMVYKDGDEEEEDDSSLPPLLKRLPKDFGGGSTDFDVDDDAGDFGTVIVKSDRGSNTRGQTSYSFKPPAPPTVSPMRARRDELDVDDDEDEEDDDGEGFGTFVVKSTVRSEREGSGTVVKRAVASMGELGFGKQKKSTSSASLQGEELRFLQNSKISSSSIPDYVTREDPSTKYELLNELGEFIIALIQS